VLSNEVALRQQFRLYMRNHFGRSRRVAGDGQPDLDFYLRTQYSSTYGRPITYLTGSSLVPRCTRRVIFVYPTPAQFLVAAHPAATQRTGTAWALVVELDPAPPRCPSES
jgi:hypothetical protein